MHFVILGLLLAGPLTLYDTQKRFENGLSHFYSASFGSIERALRRLISEGAAVVEAEPGSARGRKLYRITQDGRSAWREWMHAQTPPGSDLEKTALAKVFLLGRLEDQNDVVRVIQNVRREAETARNRLQSMATEVDAQAVGFDEAARLMFLYQRSTLDYGLKSHDTLIQWLEELENGLRP